MAGLMLLASTPAAARPSTTKLPTTPTQIGTVIKIVNGTALVGTSCAPEFPDYDHSVSFFERPTSICVRWENREPVASAVWELWKDKPDAADQKIATGNLPASSLSGGTHSTFNISLSSLPKFNETSKNQRYYVKIISKKNARDTNTLSSGRGLLIHKPKSQQPQPQPDNPYVCNPSPDKYVRTVQLMIPKMTVNQTTSTSGDGDRDELYFKVDRLGPGTDHGAKRLPGDDDYYEAYQGKTSDKKWTNQDEEKVARPSLWQGKIKHGQKILLGITAMEQDNSNLADIRNSLIDAFNQVVQTALHTNNSYGAIVAAVAAALLAGSSLIPQTRGHDFVGYVGVQLENRCGNVRLVWTTFKEWKVGGIGTLRNDFPDSNFQSLESRLVVHSLPPSGFQNPAGVDWGDYQHKKLKDAFTWRANGSSGSQYTFTLQSRLFTPEELQTIANATGG